MISWERKLYHVTRLFTSHKRGYLYGFNNNIWKIKSSRILKFTILWYFITSLSIILLNTVQTYLCIMLIHFGDGNAAFFFYCSLLSFWTSLIFTFYIVDWGCKNLFSDAICLKIVSPFFLKKLSHFTHYLIFLNYF